MNRHALAVAVLAAFLGASAAAAPRAPADPLARVRQILKTTPLIDGHNDVPWQVRERFERDPARLMFNDTAGLTPPMHTDISRLRAGGMGAQFWSVYVPATTTGPQAVKDTFEQIDITRRVVAAHPTVFEMAYTAADIVRIHKAGKIASLIGMEGGHSMDNSMAVLRQLYAAGARYMTITHSKTTDWADASTDAPRHGGLSPFGEQVIREMNRLGMMVDLSHVSAETMRDAIAVSSAPVMFSHSSAFAIAQHPRNVPDDVLRLVRDKGGVVMVTFVPVFVSEDMRRWAGELAAVEARLKQLNPGDPERVTRELDAWRAANPLPGATLAQVADHIEHVRNVAGVDHVGLGGDYDGTDFMPVGLEGVDGYPALLAELMRRGWTEADIRKLAGENLLKVMRDVEAAAARLQTTVLPSSATLGPLDRPTR